jgi:predicted esterase
MRFERDGARRARRMAMICTLLGLAAMGIAPLARSAAPPPRPREVAVYAPQGAPDEQRPVTVLLHGLCGHPESACGPFVDVSTERGWLVCPRGEDACGTGSRWRLEPGQDGRLVEDAVGELAREQGGRVDTSAPRVIVGFSLGGIAAVRIAEAGSGQYAGLVVIASQVHPSAERLARAGVSRVVLAAGDYDMTSAPLQEDAAAMNRAGLATRFVSLGRVGHGYPPDMEARMREPMAWVNEGARATRTR